MGDSKSNTETTRFKLIQAKRIIGFFCLFVLIYVLLMAPWPGLRTAYSKFYRAGAAFLFESFGSRGVVRFLQSGNVDFDINIVFYNRDRIRPDGKVAPSLAVPHASRYAGYMCTALMVALVLATPIPFRRRGWALLWGMILMHGFIAFKMAILILNPFTNESQLALFVLNPFWKRLLSITTKVFVTNMTPSLVVSAFIWILVSFRREDWSRILTQRKNSG